MVNLHRSRVRAFSAWLWMAVIAGTLACVPCALDAQLAGGFDTGILSRYAWRGLTRRNGAVWQTDAFGAWRLGSSFVTVGLWTSIEVVRARTDLPDAIGLGRFAGEVDGWAEWTYFCGCRHVDFGLGYTRYHFFRPDTAAALGDTVYQTGEAYARLMAHFLGFTPRVAAWYDPEATKGAYVETELSYDFIVLPAGMPVLRLGALAGFSVGQARNGSVPAEPSYFARNGLTHLDFYLQPQLSLALVGLPLYALPAAHFTLNFDPKTKVVDRTGRMAKTRFWVGWTVTWHTGR